MPVVINFTLDPLRSWLKYRSEDNKASTADYLERVLASEAPNTAATTIASTPGPRARIDVASGTTSSTAQTASPATSEQVELAARLRHDVLFSTTGTRGRADDEDR